MALVLSENYLYDSFYAIASEKLYQIYFFHSIVKHKIYQVRKRNFYFFNILFVKFYK